MREGGGRGGGEHEVGEYQLLTRQLHEKVDHFNHLLHKRTIKLGGGGLGGTRTDHIPSLSACADVLCVRLQECPITQATLHCACGWCVWSEPAT